MSRNLGPTTTSTFAGKWRHRFVPARAGWIVERQVRQAGCIDREVDGLRGVTAVWPSERIAKNRCRQLNGDTDCV